MYATSNVKVPNGHTKLVVTTEELQALLSCGRYAAIQIGNAAEARVQVGKRVFWNVKKVEEYINLHSK